MKRLFFVLAFAIFLSLTVSATAPLQVLQNFSIVNKICAQANAQENLQRGIKCEVQYSGCEAFGPNWGNLLRDLREGKITVTTAGEGTTSSATEVLIKVMSSNEYFADRISKYCYDKSVIKDIVELKAPISAVAAERYGPSINHLLTVFSAVPNDISIFRACGNGTTYTRNSDPLIGTYVGCCPSGYRITLGGSLVGSTAGSTSFVGGACCLAQGGLDPFIYNNGKCRDKNQLPLADGADNYVVGTENLKIALPVNGNLNATIDLRDFYGQSVGFYQLSREPRAPLACPSGTVCAIDASGNLDGVRSAKDYSVPNTSTNLQCGRCFMDGQLIGISQNTDGTGFARFCDSKADNGLYRDDPLIGGSGSITQGAGLEEGENQELYKSCFESGGIYTAIGCVDPTPTGIITGLIRVALGIMGGIALMQLVYVGILYQMGDMEKIKKARSQLFATLSGLFVLVFSILILRIIGINILDVIPVGGV